MCPLLEQFLSGIPPEARGQVGWVAAGGAAIGAALWLIGARFSRSIITLAAVAAGAFVGLRLPRWTMLPVDDWAGAIIGALVAGVSAFALHRLWASVMLALLLAAWGAAGAWSAYGPGSEWNTPAWQEGVSATAQARETFESLPEQLRRIGPWAAGVGMITGLALGLVWSRMATVLLYSVLGTSMVAALGTMALELRWPEMVGKLPAMPQGRWMLLGGMVMMGVAVQWMLLPKGKRKAEGKSAAPKGA